MPARVASITAFGAALAAVDAGARCAPLVTPLQLQTCVSAGISSNVDLARPARRYRTAATAAPPAAACCGRRPASGRRPC